MKSLKKILNSNRNLIKTLSILIFSGAFYLSPLFSQDKSNFENPIILGKSEGLDVNIISSVVVDKNGFVWIGSNKGLYRYDGYMFIKYTNEPGDSSSLISNNIRHLYFDKTKNQLWISTWEVAKGLSILDLNTFKFKNYYYNEKTPGGITGAGLFWTYKDKFDQYWVSTNGLARYVPESDTFRRVSYEMKPSDVNVKVGDINKMISYSQDQNNDSLLWIGTDSGLLKFNVITERFKRYPLVKFRGNGYTMRSILHHSDNKVYVGTWSAGMYAFDPDNEEFLPVSFFDETILPGKAINRIQCISKKAETLLWIKTAEGLVEYNTERNEVANILRNNIAKKEIYGVNYKDSHKRIFTWFNSSQDDNTELHIYSPYRQQLKTFSKIDRDPKYEFLPRRIVEDPDSQGLWIISQNSEGLYFLDLLDNSWTTIPPNGNYFIEKHESFRGWDMLKTREGKILVLENSAIYEYSEDEGILIPWPQQPESKGVEYRRMIEDKNGFIWVGTRIQGLFKIDPVTGKVNHYDGEMSDDKEWSFGSITDMQEDRNGNIWIRSTGYSVYDVKKDTFYNFEFFFPEEETVRHIAALGIDKNGNTWISTTSNGEINAIGVTNAEHPELGIVRHFMMNDHFKSEKAMEFFLDANEDLWLLSKDLEKITTDGRSQTFYSDQMMNKKDFNTALSLSSGDIAIGFREGLGIFNPENMNFNANDIFPYVHSISVFNKETVLDPFDIPDEPFELKPNENFIGLQISAINPLLDGDIEYQYQLIGVDRNWVDIKNHSFINYSNVKSGNYIFNLRARYSGNDKWESNIYKLDIKILKPWYFTNIAYIIYFLVTVFTLYYLSKFIITKNFMQQEAKRLQELDAIKTRFYGNITHEFRTPLTVIRGLAEEAIENPEHNFNEKIGLIRRNSDKLLNLVNQMLDLSKLKAGKTQISYTQSDIVRYLKYLVEAHSSLARMKNINLRYICQSDEIIMDFDPKKLERIVTNLLSNAIKFSSNHSEVLVIIKRLEGILGIDIIDKGIGIKKEELPYIFDRFHQTTSDTNNQGSGIGLALVKEIIQQMGGKIEVKSRPNSGSTFSVFLPIQNNAPYMPALQSEFQSIESLNSNKTIIKDLNNDLPILLLIEDNFDIAFYIKIFLENTYNVIHSIDGKDGFDKAIDIIPDIIISDVMMPKMDGFELCSMIKSDDRINHIPVILLTAMTTSEDKIKGLSRGADAYLTKPFEKEELLVRLKMLLENRAMLQDKYRKSTLETSTPEKTKHPFLIRVEKIILENLNSEDLSINELAKILHLSTSQVYRKIKALTGMSTAIFIRHIRLKKAQEFLVKQEWNISEIAFKTGFSSLAYFSQSFKEAFGESPSSFQKKKLQS